MSDLGLWPLPLLLIANTSRLCLKIANIAQVSPDGACAEWIGLRAAAVLLVGRAEAADEGVEAAPGLSERAGTRGRWVGETEERAWVVVNLSLPELVEVVEEFQHVRTAAKGQGEWGTVVPQVLAEGVPVPSLLVLVAARSSSAPAIVASRRRRRHRRRRWIRGWRLHLVHAAGV